MILFVNRVGGQLIRLVSVLAIQFISSLKIQFLKVRHGVETACNSECNFEKILISALVCIEDRRFYSHMGIDPFAIIRASWANLTTPRLEGASTIVQQLVRNLTGQREVSFKRKMKEIIFASLLDKHFSKHKILSAYLNTYAFNNCVGVKQFCQNEGYSLKTMSIKEAAEVAARFKYPVLNQGNIARYLKRVRRIEVKTTPNSGSGISRAFLYLPSLRLPGGQAPSSAVWLRRDDKAGRPNGNAQSFMTNFTN
jgi:hypothetical protein